MAFAHMKRIFKLERNNYQAKQTRTANSR